MTEIIAIGAGLLSPIEWRAAAMLLIFTFVATESAKRLWRLTSRPWQRADVWLISIAVGAFGAYWVWPGDSVTPFWIAGPAVGGSASFLHRYFIILIRWKAPALGDLITGDRRVEDNGNGDEVDRRD